MILRYYMVLLAKSSGGSDELAVVKFLLLRFERDFDGVAIGSDA